MIKDWIRFVDTISSSGIRTRQSSGFFSPIFCGRDDRAEYNTRKGNKPSRLEAVVESRPPLLRVALKLNFKEGAIMCVQSNLSLADARAIYIKLLHSIYLISDLNGVRQAADRGLLPENLIGADYFAQRASDLAVEQIDKHLDLLNQLKVVIEGGGKLFGEEKREEKE